MNRRNLEKKDIVDFITANPGCNSRQLQKGAGCGTSHYYDLMKELQEAGVIHRKGNTSAATWWPGEDELDKRNILIMRLICLSKDINRVAVDVDEYSEVEASMMRSASKDLFSLSEELKRNQIAN